MPKITRIVEYMKFCKCQKQIETLNGFETFLSDILLYSEMDTEDRYFLIKGEPYWDECNWQSLTPLASQKITEYESTFLKKKELENLKRLGLDKKLDARLTQLFLSYDHDIDTDLKSIMKSQDDEIEYTEDYQNALKQYLEKSSLPEITQKS